MVYNNNVPQPGDVLSDSQVDLLNNFQQLNTSFGIDHYPFTDNSVNLGEHNQVTQPQIIGAAHPVTAAGQVKLYNMNDLAAIGSLEYSRGPSSAVPSPVTYLQSPAAAIALGTSASTNVLDFDGIADFCGATIYVWSVLQATQNIHIMGCSQILYNQFAGPTKTLTVTTILNAFPVTFVMTGTILSILNSGNPAFIKWSLQFYRIQN